MELHVKLSNTGEWSASLDMLAVALKQAAENFPYAVGSDTIEPGDAGTIYSAAGIIATWTAHQ